MKVVFKLGIRGETNRVSKSTVVLRSMTSIRNSKFIISVFIEGRKGRSNKGSVKRPEEDTTLQQWALMVSNSTIQKKKNFLIKKTNSREFCCSSGVMNPTSIHEDEGSMPVLTQI